jgi:Spy/CpxP family protein refolding chaperone
MGWLVIVLAALWSLAVYAQQSDQNAAPGAQDSRPRGQMGPGGPRGPMTPEMELDRLTKELNLTKDQQDKIKPILEDRHKQMTALREDTSVSREDRFTKTREIRKTTDDKIREVLTPEQQTKLEEMQKRMMERRGPRGGAAVEHCLQIIEAASIPLTHLDLEGKELRCWFTIADVPDWGEVRKRLDTVLAGQVEFGEEGAVTMVGHGIGGNPSIINKARASAVGAVVPLNAVSVSPLRVTLWCDRPHVDNLVRALHKTFVE